MNDTRIFALRHPINITLLFLFFGTCFAIYFSFILPKLTHHIPPIIKPHVSFSHPQPENIGYIAFRKIDTIPANVVMAGDSLARGKGSILKKGTIETLGYLLVNQANKINHGIAKYHGVHGLAVDGSSVEQLTEQLNSHSKILEKIPNLVLFLSFTNKDMQNFILDAEKIHSGNRLAAFFQVAQILNRDSKTYQHSLVILNHTLTTIQSNRVKILGKKQAVMQAVILGLPNEVYSPSVESVLHTYHITYGEFSYVINIFNEDDRYAVEWGNKDQIGITYSFINLANLRVPKKMALKDLAPDEFHPNYHGYETLANYIAGYVVIGQTKAPQFLVKK